MKYPKHNRRSESVSIVVMFLVALLALQCAPSRAAAQDQVHDFDEFTRWFDKYKDAKPDFKPGDVLTRKDIERIRPFVFPGFLERLDFPESTLPIVEYKDHTPARAYADCTEKYQHQVKLDSDGIMSSYVCGQPFPDTDLIPGDVTSGVKASWNWEFRWQNFGLSEPTLYLIWVRYGGNHQDSMPPPAPSVPEYWLQGLDFDARKLPTTNEDIYGGGGTFQRSLGVTYQRIYLSHLAQLQDQGGLLPVSGAKDFEYKEFVGFFSPFDIRGTAFIVYRYSDPRRADDAWAYIPTLRRVRRITAEVKSDSLLGTDHTIEDFYGFAGRSPEWNWKFLGWKNTLCVFDSKNDVMHSWGENGLVMHDQWEIRKFAVIARTPKRPSHPYGVVVNFWDAQNWDNWFEVAFDRRMRLWKIWQYPKRWSEDVSLYKETNQGLRLTNFEGIIVDDVQNRRGTLNTAWAVGYPTTRPDRLQVFEPSYLEHTHR